MKKFTCLLIALLASNMVLTGTCPALPTATAGPTFIGMVVADTANFAAAGNLAGASSAAGPTASCAAAGATTLMCLTGTALQTWVNTKLANLKTALTTYGAQISKFGGYIAKISAVTNYSNLTTAYLSAASTDLDITSDQAKMALSYYNNSATYTADFALFTGQLETCFTAYSMIYQKVACIGAAEATANVAPFTGTNADTNGADIKINVASCLDWATKCNKVWSFLHKVGSSVHVAAYINKKRDTTKTYTVPKFSDSSIYYSAGTTALVTSIFTAVTNCAVDASAANTACLPADRLALCQSFSKLYDATMPIARTSLTFLSTNDPTTSFTSTRRQLSTVTTGAVVVTDTASLDLTAATAYTVGLGATPTTFASADYSTWSAGYVAASSGSSSSSSSSSTTKSAKVVIGTILSALFAVAFLN